ncbi:HNH endonuclease [Vibrio breoganii]|uniref:HNH endonuclease n=2 Tax=Vibrio TaxID=662 RepID=UPI0010BD6CD8|nr:HNH endonuclease signature motif containing protein [Vibrio breoganii]TKF90339.1 HNH endonuclease [Vibrio breoganii]
MYKYTVSDDYKKITIQFQNKPICNAVGRFEFFSRLLYELKPNASGVWEVCDVGRLNAYIKGFPPEITWERISDKVLVANGKYPLTQDHIDDIGCAIDGIIGTKENEFTKTVYSFSIVDLDSEQEHNYEFLGRARSVGAFCVLWDMNDHPRDHLEISRSKSLKILDKYPQSTNNNVEKYYSDPSKTVDECRNEGFPRDTDQSKRGTYIKVSRRAVYGTSQEHYQLLKREQSLDDRVGRSQIPDKYKRKLYADADYTCQHCGQVYEERYLAPDHRVPSIVQADNLSQDNYLDVLQTLCVRCNQVKRESCKKCQYDHDCEKCSWAYPERFGITEATKIRLEKIAKHKGILTEELMIKVAEKLEESFTQD